MRLAMHACMHGWPWCYEPEELRRDRRYAALVLGGFSAILVMSMTIELCSPRPPGSRCSDDGAPARALAATIRTLADGGPCGAALARLPEVVPAATLRADPWGAAWSIRCHGDLAVVRSAGPDGDVGTDDDVVEVAQIDPNGARSAAGQQDR